jgi:hypothetical protein
MSEHASELDEGRDRADVRIAILSSHRGAHLQTLLEDPVVGSWVALVVADRPDAYALRHAEWHGVPGVALRMGRSNLDLFDRALARMLEEHSIDYVVVAGSHGSSGPKRCTPTKAGSRRCTIRSSRSSPDRTLWQMS